MLSNSGSGGRGGGSGGGSGGGRSGRCEVSQQEGQEHGEYVGLVLWRLLWWVHGIAIRWVPIRWVVLRILHVSNTTIIPAHLEGQKKVQSQQRFKLSEFDLFSV